MKISTVNDGYTALAEAVIKTAVCDLKSKSKEYHRRKHKFMSCLFFLDSDSKDLFTGLAPHMIRVWEQNEVKAKEIMDSPFASDFLPKDGKRSRR
ncbi:MAG: hypothetical protein IJG69_09500 [Spirochaetales bacterium]|nr:hypothetical protein [Spirochaetales bacterium]